MKLFDGKTLIGHIASVNTYGDGRIAFEMMDYRRFEFDGKDVLYVSNGNYWLVTKRSSNLERYLKPVNIKNVIFNPPATIVFWSDGTKTVVKCSKDDKFDPEKGLAMAICKRVGGNKAAYYKDISKWCKRIPIIKTKDVITMDRAEVIKLIKSMQIECDNALTRFADSLDMTAFVASMSIKLDLAEAVIEQMK